MPKDRPSSKKNQKLAGNHQKCWLWGRHAVTETVRAGKWLPKKILLGEELSEEETGTIRQFCSNQDVPVEVVSNSRLKQLSKSAEHQGYLAQMPEFRYDSFDELFAEPAGSLVFILDRIQDPHNFGAILRSAEVLGVDAVLVGQQEQVGVTTSVARSSAGAVNHLPVIQVDDLQESVKKLHSLDFNIFGTSLEKSQCLTETKLTGAVAIIIGNEGTGVSEELLQLCANRIRIPQQGQLDSLNAAVAAGIIMYEASRQRLP